MENNTAPADDGSFIIKNITRGPLCINSRSGLSLTIPSFEYEDLSDESSSALRSSDGLRKALIAGYARRISRAEADAIERRKLAAVTEAQTRAMQGAKRRKVRDGNRVMDAEYIDVNTASGQKRGEEVSSFGYASDPASYAKARQVYESETEARYGRVPSDEEFADAVDRDPNIVRRLLTGDANSSVTPGFAPAQAFVSHPSENDQFGSRVRTASMNPFPDPEMPTFHDPIYDDDDDDENNGLAEEFNLEDDLAKHPTLPEERF